MEFATTLIVNGHAQRHDDELKALNVAEHISVALLLERLGSYTPPPSVIP
ncbi:MAG: hypothetical protein M3137_05060 [Actinomycetota bacterium]|nr:hypothetical protein [Actinomycetota bacterium]